jgi:hypothetical protein
LEKTNRLTLFVLIAALAAVYFFVFGESGMIMRMELGKQRARLLERIDGLKDEGARMRNLYARYRKGELNREEARLAGFVEQGERFVFMRGAKEEQSDRAPEGREPGYFPQIDHLRILWVVISVLAVFLFLARAHKKAGDPAAS